MKVIQIHLRTFYFEGDQRCHPDSMIGFLGIDYKNRFYSKKHQSIYYHINKDIRDLNLPKGLLVLDNFNYPPKDLELLPEDFEIDINARINNVFLQPSRVIKFSIKGKEIKL